VLYKEQDPADSVYLLASGSVTVSRLVPLLEEGAPPSLRFSALAASVDEATTAAAAAAAAAGGGVSGERRVSRMQALANAVKVCLRFFSCRSSFFFPLLSVLQDWV
jgi:hypothetical protein